METELLVQADRLVGGRDAVLVIDDTAIPKKGVQSVGVAAQYASALGKTANCQPCATLSSNSALDYRRSDARTVGNGFATNGGMSKSAKVVLASPLDNEQFKDELEDAIASLCRIRARLGKGQQA